MKKVSVVIPVYNNLKITCDCLSDLMMTYGVEIETVVVDDGSKEPISKAISKMFPQVKVLKNEENLGFARAVNKGIKAASNPLICLLNNDIRLPNPAWLKIMVESMDKYGLDMTAPAFGRLSLPNYEYLPGEVKENTKINKREFTYPVFWCALLRKSVFNKIGLISEAYNFGFFEDVDYYYRAKKEGFKAGITENIGVVHYYHTTFKKEGYDLNKQYNKNRKIFLDIIKKEG